MRRLLRTDPKLAWIAFEDGRSMGFSVGFVRHERCFLADLLVLPEAHGKGVGGELLQRCLTDGREGGARIPVRSYVIDTMRRDDDPGAQALYIRAGMVPASRYLESRAGAASTSLTFSMWKICLISLTLARRLHMASLPTGPDMVIMRS